MKVLQILDFESGIMMNFHFSMCLYVKVTEVKTQIVKKGVYMAPFFLEILGPNRSC